MILKDVIEDIGRLFATTNKSQVTYIQPGNSAQNINNKGVSKMATDNKLVLTMEWVDGQGVSRFDLTANYKVLDYAGIVTIQKAVSDAMNALGAERVG